jgi:hypothetical protein
MESFLSDCWKAYVISDSYGMGDPLAFRFREAGRTAEGGGLPAIYGGHHAPFIGGHHPSVTV